MTIKQTIRNCLMNSLEAQLQMLNRAVHEGRDGDRQMSATYSLEKALELRDAIDWIDSLAG